MAKNTRAAATAVVETPVVETVAQAFAVKSHSKRSEIKGAARNRTIKGRGVTIYLGMVDGKLHANSTTQVDYITGTKESAYVKFCSEQTSHAWMKKVGDTGRFIYIGSEAMGTDAAWSDLEAADVRKAVQEAISAKFTTTWSGRLTGKGGPLPANAQAEIAKAVAAVGEMFSTPTEINPADEGIEDPMLSLGETPLEQMAALN